MKGQPEPVQVVKTRRDGALNRLVAGVPYIQWMGIRFDRRGDELTAIRLGLERADARTERYIKDVDADVKRDRETMHRHIDYADGVVAEARKELADLKATCPARILHFVSENID